MGRVHDIRRIFLSTQADVVKKKTVLKSQIYYAVYSAGVAPEVNVYRCDVELWSGGVRGGGALFSPHDLQNS